MATNSPHPLAYQFTHNEKCVIYAALAILAICTLLSFVLPTNWHAILDNTHWTATSAAAAWLTWQAYLKANSHDKPIKYWFFVGYACYFTGQLLFDMQTALNWQPFPAPSDMFYPLLGVAFIVGFLKALKAHLSRAKFLAAKIDLFALVSALLGLILVLYLPKRGEVDYFELFVLTTYPVSLLSAACLSVFMIAYIKPKLNLAWWCLAIGLSIEGLIWMQWNLDSLSQLHQNNVPINKLFSLCDILVACAVLQWSIVVSTNKPFLYKCLKWQSLVPVAAFFLTSLTIVLIWLSDQQQPYSYYIGLTSIILVMLFSLLRQSVLLGETEKLLSAELQLKEKEQQYQHLKNYDTLTDLPNRTQCESYIDATLQAAASNKQTFSLFYIDIDRFKLINDSLGNALGDMLLLAVSQRLKQHFSKHFLARLSGDKFVLLIEQANKQALAAESAQSIINLITPAYQLKTAQLTIDVSIGISMYPKDTSNTAELIRNADSAMFNAKRFGGSNYQFYTAELMQKAHSKLALDINLRAAIKNHHFHLDYQPIYAMNHADTLTIQGTEALIRWNNEGDLVPPYEFIAYAEATGFIVEIGNWVIEQSFKQMAQWNKTLPRPLCMSINLSPRQFYDKNLVANISAGIAQYQLNPTFIKLEITEGTLFDQEDAAIAILGELKTLGVQISLDDFGTGHSSLSQLKKIPLDQIKLDRSFLQGVPTNKFDNEIVLSIINMANALGIETVCEGIETQAQLDFIKNTHCKIYQGFLLSKPISPDSVTALVMGSK